MTPALPETAVSADVDLYESFVPGRVGMFPKKGVVRKGFTADDVDHVDHLVLKPDGDFFAEQYACIRPGARKGDVEPRRTCVLRYLKELFPKAEVRDSRGTDASFHVIIPVDKTVSESPRSDRPRFLRLLDGLRVLSFCDKIGGGLLGALTARAVGSVNSKSGKTVARIQPGSGTYSLDELEKIVADWMAAPEVAIVCGWFGVEPGRVRCPFHDSTDNDLTIQDAGEEHAASVSCFGAQHCAKDAPRGVARIPMVPSAKSNVSVAGLILADDAYRKKWISEFNKLRKGRKRRREPVRDFPYCGRKMVTYERQAR